MSQNNKAIIGVVGGLALLGLAYWAYSSRESSMSEADHSSDLDKQLIKKVLELGTVVKDKDGKIKFEYLLKFCECVGRQSKHHMRKAVEGSKEARLDALKAKDDALYTKILSEIMAQEEAISD